MTFDMEEFKANLGETYRPSLYEVDVDGYPGLKYRVISVDYTFTDLGSGFDSMTRLMFQIIEDETFSARRALDKLYGRKLTLRTFSKKGVKIYEETKIIKRVSFSGGFSWESKDSIFCWDVDVTLEDEVNDKLED
jgi:hypothetical protein